MYLVDEKLKALIQQAQERGNLTFQLVDEYLPDEGGDSRMVDHIVLALEATGLDVIDDPPPKPKPKPTPEESSNSTSPAMQSLIARRQHGCVWRNQRRAIRFACTSARWETFPCCRGNGKSSWQNKLN